MSAREQLYTTADFEAFVAQHPDQRFELIHGEIVEKMPTQLHSLIVAVLTQFLMNHIDAHPIGWVLPEARYQLPADPRNSRIPDLSFVLSEGRTVITQGPLPYMPDLAIEAQSPAQGRDRLREKAQYYLANGTRVVWLIFPEEKQIEVVTAGGKTDMLSTGDVLTLETLAPGLTIPVQAVFKFVPQ